MRTDLQLLLIATGGALGAICRYGISQLSASMTATTFPLGTLTANLIGCFSIGLLMGSGLLSKNETARLGLGVGFLGALTTFSTFGSETMKHIQQDQWGLAIGNITSNLILGLLAVMLGIACGKRIWG